MLVPKELYVLSVSVFIVHSFQLDCKPDNQFRFYCFPIEYCSNIICNTDRCGRFDINSTIVRIKETQLIPKCAFTNSKNLQHIYGVNSKIQVLASDSFVNLPVLKSIQLSFNLIKELHRGIFRHVTASLLDLSWNKIVYVEDRAFDGLDDLTYLNLSRNELMTLPVRQLLFNLKEIDLSYNFFNRIAFNSRANPNLTKIDLSYNIIQNIALSFQHPVEKIDLTHNHLDKFDFIDVRFCEELKIGLNHFSSPPVSLTYLNVKRLALYPNPWLCVELQNLWVHLQNHFVTLLKEEISDGTGGDKPICVANPPHPDSGISNTFSTSRTDENIMKCGDDSQCGSNMVCRSLRCWNPCDENVCDSDSICEATDHAFKCLCPKNLRRDPKDIYSPCIAPECLFHTDCVRGSYCRDNKCLNVSSFSPLRSEYEYSSNSNNAYGSYNNYESGDFSNTARYGTTSGGYNSPGGVYGGSNSGYGSKGDGYSSSGSGYGGSSSSYGGYGSPSGDYGSPSGGGYGSSSGGYGSPSGGYGSPSGDYGSPSGGYGSSSGGFVGLSGGYDSPGRGYFGSNSSYGSSSGGFGSLSGSYGSPGREYFGAQYGGTYGSTPIFYDSKSPSGDDGNPYTGFGSAGLTYDSDSTTPESSGSNSGIAGGPPILHSEREKPWWFDEIPPTKYAPLKKLPSY